MKSTEKIVSNLPAGDGSTVDPDFNDELPGRSKIDPDASEFRDEIQVTSYATSGALQVELDRERVDAEQATLDVLQAMRAMDAGDQVKWRISRSGHENDELNGYLETWPNHQMTIERLRDRFGGGTYYCKGFRRGKYTAHETLQISGEAKRKPSGVEGVSSSIPVGPAAPSFDVQGFLMAQERRDEKRAQADRQERIEREERDEKRRAERMQLLLTLGPAAITALGGLFQGRPDNTAALLTALKPPDLLTTMTQLKALQGNNQEGLLTKLLPMVIDLAGSKASSGDTGWLDIIKEFAKGAGPAVGGLIEAQLKAAQVAQISAPMLPEGQQPLISPLNPTPHIGHVSVGSPIPIGAPNGNNPTIVVPDSLRRRERGSAGARGSSPAGSHTAPAEPSPGRRAPTVASSSPSNGSGNPDMNLMSLLPHLPWLRDVLTRMFQAAQRGKSPQVYAALFLEEVPDEVSGETVLELLGAQNWFANICKVVPQWNDSQLYPWLDTARREILITVQRSMGPPHAAAHDATQPRVTQASTPVAAPPRQQATDGIDRPTKLPSLTGD